jgi:YesN/AraC family two-component response regulator
MSGILIVDDEEGILMILRRILTALRPGCAIKTANNGLVAWQELQNDSFDLLLTDYYMPGLTGLELAQQVQNKSPDLPIVLMSGGGESDKMQGEAQRLGLAGFLAKPFSVCQLRSLLETTVPES